MIDEMLKEFDRLNKMYKAVKENKAEIRTVILRDKHSGIDFPVELENTDPDSLTSLDHEIWELRFAVYQKIDKILETTRQYIYDATFDHEEKKDGADTLSSL